MMNNFAPPPTQLLMPETLIGETAAIVALRQQLDTHTGHLLLSGERGTEFFSLIQALEKPLCWIRRNHIADRLLQNMLIGHDANAFSGAIFKKDGAIATAQSGVIVIEGIESADTKSQEALALLIERKTYSPLGSGLTLPINCRFVFLAHQINKLIPPLKKLIETELKVPPLRKRQSDIPRLARYFLDIHSDRKHQISPKVMERLMQYRWPGNTFELQAVITHLIWTSTQTLITEGDFRKLTPIAHAPVALERESIRDVLANSISKRDAAQKLGWSRQQLVHKLKQLGLDS